GTAAGTAALHAYHRCHKRMAVAGRFCGGRSLRRRQRLFAKGASVTDVSLSTLDFGIPGQHKASRICPGILPSPEGNVMPTLEPKPLIDTSKMSPAQREALELTESAREAAHAERSFAGGLFVGRFGLARIHPFPVQSSEDREQGDEFLRRLETFLK